MSISIVSNAISAPAPQQPFSRRQQEDVAGRQFEQAIQSGDLAAATAAYNKLAAFGPNNSGPFVDPALAKQFAAVGQALQAGDLATAQQETTQLGTNLLKHDLYLVRQEYKAGGGAGAQQAIQNLEGDYWAVTGQGLPVSPSPTATAAPSGSQPSPAVNLQA